MICRKTVALKLYATVLFGGSFLCSQSVVRAAPQTTTQEPTAEYVLTINGKAVPLSLDKETQVTVSGARRKARVKLSRKATRTFDKAGVRFDYPVAFTFQADTSDPDSISWKITGSDSIVILQRYNPVGSEAALNEIVPEIVKSYGRETVRVVPTSLSLKGRTLSGKKLLIVDSPTQEVFTFSTARATYVLISQDNLTLDNKPTLEATQFRKLLTSTLTFR